METTLTDNPAIPKTRGPASHFRERTSCPVCGERKQPTLLSMPMDEGEIYAYLDRYYSEKGLFEPEYVRGADYHLVECPGCDLIYQRWIPDEDFLARLYGTWINPQAAVERDVKLRGSKIAQYAAELWLIRYWSRGKQLRILDYGMGHGRWCETAWAFGHHVHGYEFEAERVANALRGTTVVVGWDALAQGDWDYVHTEQVFEHLADPLGTLKHLAQGLKPGGLVRISVPGWRYIKRALARPKLDFSKGHRYACSPVVPLQHLNCYAGRSMDQLAAQAGLRPYRFPIWYHIGAQQDWAGPKKVLRNIAHPLYQRLRYGYVGARYFIKQS